jgi:hypothetical protein
MLAKQASDTDLAEIANHWVTAVSLYGKIKIKRKRKSAD